MWEEIENEYDGERGYVRLERAGVPGGWLVRERTLAWDGALMGTPITFVPDPR